MSRGEQVLMVGALWLLLPFTIICSTQANINYRNMLDAVQKFRVSTLQSNLFPAIRSLMQVQPEANPVLLRTFHGTCSKLDIEFTSIMTLSLFPNFNLPWFLPSSIPRDIERLISHNSKYTSTGVLLVLAGLREQQQYFVRMALFEWNQLVKGMEDASPELLKRINTTVDPNIYETLISRLRTARIVQSFLATGDQFNVKDAWILYKMLEYLRYLIALQWSSAIELGAVDGLERLWLAFVVNIRKHLPRNNQRQPAQKNALNTTSAKKDQ